MTRVQDTDSVERHEHVHVSPDHEERVVHDVSAEHHQMLVKVTRLIWLIGGVIEGLIGIRVLLKLIAANPNSAFARLIYGTTDLFLWPFFGLTATPSANGAVLEIPSLIAMLVYALFFWAVVKFIWVIFDRPRSRTITTYERE